MAESLAESQAESSRYHDELRRKEFNEEKISRLATRSRLDALISQINPYFLFNALNTVGVLIDENPDEARRLTVKLAAFHEGLALVKRDRNAAWFAEDDGARLLICSEIGSEGRNFQFAHRLVLFDLPLDPEVVEQRIGRLDRIGQTATIQIHIPFVKGSSQEVLVQWYHHGLNAFEKNLHGGHELLERFGPHVKDLASDFHETGEPARAALRDLIEATRAACFELTERLENGRDRLLEMNSYRPALAERLVREISVRDQAHTLDGFMLRILDHYGIQAEELSTRTFQLGSGGVFTDSFPALRAGGMTVTCSRKEALAREDIGFLTWDHPMVTGAMDLMLGSEAGNSSFAIWSGLTSRRLLLESIHVLECVAPARLHVDRFLPATPIRIVLDHELEDCTVEYPSDLFARNLKQGTVFTLIDRPALRQTLLPEMLETSRRFAESRVPTIVTNSLSEMQDLLGHEIDRLQALKAVNKNVRQEEIELARQEMEELRAHISGARLRLDALRLFWNGQLL
jgi:ATP-dependent helicase HepA